ncbi:RNA-binding S4 domain-containing protein [Phaeovulum sp.]|uniref:RNA-binding S4 domain-containing protein n=1 Tax=Phaeovulum sp. TaxID=2934796 RepID=UPI00272F640B|nr:RNA-binding S4 domain-containing protein [Phaeovulum sp.]MDP1669439.1 RNA-binding S4 domain-containing protein [Phaeovulum sp.]MDZ4118282.1 RNA-binding S4 domain-containing protein [Phaeovulum sp.]
MTEAPGEAARIRLDKWLWQARLAKTRPLAQAMVSAGHVRINGQRGDKPGRAIGPGDVLTLRLSGGVRVLRVVGCGTRRGPAPEAEMLYQEITFGATRQDPLD